MKKYLLIVRNTFDEYLVYRLNFVLWRVRVVIRFLITYFLWSAIYQPNISLLGYTRVSMLTYVIMIYLVSNFVFATRTQDIGAEINEGRLTNYLLKPISYFKGLIARDISDKLLNLGFTIFEVVLLFIVLKPPLFIQTDFWIILLSLISLFGSLIIYFCISSLLGFLGFWTPELWATRFLFLVLLDFLAGNFFPIDILPPVISKIILLTPFPYLYYFPVKLYLGQLDFLNVVQGFIVLGIWIFALRWLVSTVWKKGLKIYSAEGK